MTIFQPSIRPMDSMWGAVQTAEQILHGIWSVTTSSHGGLILSEERQAAMPKSLRTDNGQYEEDVNWGMVVLGFEAEFRASPDFRDSAVLLAHDVIKCWKPDAYTAFTGIAVPENNSRALRDRKAYQRAIGKYCVCSAWGSWAEWVPEGKVGVCGRLVESVDHLGWPKYADGEQYALIDKDIYDKRETALTFDDMKAELIDEPDRSQC